MRIEDDIKLDFNDVLIRPKRSTLVSRKNAELDRSFSFKYSKHVWKGIPIVASNMDHVGTLNMAEVLSSFNMLTALCKFVEFPKNNDLQYLMKTIGLDVELDFETPMWLCIDIANGYTERFFSYINKVRERHSNAIITAGNVCTPEATEQIILAGADIVKLGIGPGSVCTTRNMTGVGYPQLSCIIECADAAHGLGGHVMSDGVVLFLAT
jgi:GMP reductase